jgi:hypothetical protein
MKHAAMTLRSNSAKRNEQAPNITMNRNNLTRYGLAGLTAAATFGLTFCVLARQTPAPRTSRPLTAHSTSLSGT